MTSNVHGDNKSSKTTTLKVAEAEQRDVGQVRTYQTEDVKVRRWISSMSGLVKW